MIQRIGDEWTALESTARRMGSDSAPGELRSLLQAVGRVREAIGALCAANITRVNFRAAVREALIPVLSEQAGELFPDMSRQVGDRVSASLESRLQLLEAGLVRRVEQGMDARLAALPLAPTEPSGEVPPEVFEKLAAFEARLEALAQSDQDLAAALDAQAEQARATHGAVGALGSRLTALAEDLRHAEAGVGEVNFRVAELESRTGQTDAAVLEVAAAQRELALLEPTLRAVIREEAERQRAEWEGGIARVDAAASRAAEGVRRLEALLPEALREKARELETGFQARIDQRLRRELEQANGRWQVLLARLETSLQATVEARTEARSAAVLEQLRAEIAATSDRLTASLGALERSVPGTVEGTVRDAVDRLQSSLRAEIQQTSQAVLGLLAQLESEVPVTVDARLSTVAAQLACEGKASLGAAVDGLDDRISALRAVLHAELANLDQKQGKDLAAARSAAESQLQSAIDGLAARTEQAREELRARLQGLESSVPETVSASAEKLDLKLHREMDAMLDNLTLKISELRDLMARVEGALPRRETATSIDDRLGRLETRLGQVSTRVESIDSLTPEMRTLADRFSKLREDIGAVSSSVEANSNSLGGLKDGMAMGLSELETLLRCGIQRWEEDQSHLLERLSAIRDTLRDQLRTVGERVEDAGGLLGKLTGRRDGGVRLSKDDWDHVSTKLEGIISGLETILSKKQASK